METVHRWSEYTAHIESILRILRVFWYSTRSTSNTNGRNAASTCTTSGADPWNTWEVHGVSKVSNPEMLRVRQFPQYWTSIYCEYSQYPQYINKPEILQAHQVPAVFSLENTLFTPKYWEHLWNLYFFGEVLSSMISARWFCVIFFDFAWFCVLVCDFVWVCFDFEWFCVISCDFESFFLVLLGLSWYFVQFRSIFCTRY